jgi:hypothetical protein
VKKNAPQAESVPGFPTFAPQFQHHQNLQDNMDEIKNSRGKGYCILYILMGLFFLISVILMLYNRSSVLDFGR